MTSVSPHQEPKWRRLPEERPQQIIDAALEVFGERGLANARLEDIAKRAGVSKGTIYLYFPNKEELFREMIRHNVIGCIERGERELAPGTATEQVRAFARRYWTFLRTPVFEKVMRLVQGELHQFPDLAEFYSREVIQRASTLICGIIENGVRDGEFRDVDPVIAGRMLTSMLLSHAIWCGRRMFFPHVANRTDEQVLQEILDFYFQAIRQTPTTRKRAGAR